jgi:hypothetical protein
MQHLSRLHRITAHKIVELKLYYMSFWNHNKVFILGLIGAIAVSVQEFATQPVVDYKVLGFAALMAVLSYFAKEWRGQGLSITGIVGTLAATFMTVYQTGSFTWLQFTTSAVLAVLAASGADPKSRGYEATQTISNAKAQGEAINPASLTTKPK